MVLGIVESVALLIGLLAFVESARPAVLLVEAVGLVVVVVVSVTVELLAVLGLEELLG